MKISKSIRLCILLSLLVFNVSVDAKPRVKKAVVPATPSDIEVAIPRSQMTYEKPAVIVPGRTSLELLLSDWNPSHFHSDSYVENARNFERSSIPAIEINFQNRLWQNANFEIKDLFGLRFVGLERTADLTTNGSSRSISQKAYIYSAQLGLLVTSNSYYFGWLKPYASVALLPTYLQAPSTSMSEGIAKSVLGTEESLGAKIFFSSLGQSMGFYSANLSLGLIWTQSQDSNNALDGKGIRLGFEVYL